MLIAVYWTLKKWYWNHRLLEWATFLKEDFVPFLKIAGSWFPIAKFNFNSKLSDNEKYLLVELYNVSEDMMPRIDWLEWHPNWYRRTPIQTTSWIDVEIYDMWSRDFQDESERFKVNWSEIFYKWI